MIDISYSDRFRVVPSGPGGRGWVGLGWVGGVVEWVVVDSCVSLVTLGERDVPVAAAGDSGKWTGQ